MIDGIVPNTEVSVATLVLLLVIREMITGYFKYRSSRGRSASADRRSSSRAFEEAVIKLHEENSAILRQIAVTQQVMAASLHTAQEDIKWVAKRVAAIEALVTRKSAG